MIFRSCSRSPLQPHTQSSLAQQPCKWRRNPLERHRILQLTNIREFFQAPYQYPNFIWPSPLREQNTSEKELSKFKGNVAKKRVLQGAGYGMIWHTRNHDTHHTLWFWLEWRLHSMKIKALQLSNSFLATRVAFLHQVA